MYHVITTVNRIYNAKAESVSKDAQVIATYSDDFESYEEAEDFYLDLDLRSFHDAMHNDAENSPVGYFKVEKKLIDDLGYEFRNDDFSFWFYGVPSFDVDELFEHSNVRFLREKYDDRDGCFFTRATKQIVESFIFYVITEFQIIDDSPNPPEVIRYDTVDISGFDLAYLYETIPPITELLLFAATKGMN